MMMYINFKTLIFLSGCCKNKAAAINASPTVNAGADATITRSTGKAIVYGKGTDVDGTMWRFIWKNIRTKRGYYCGSKKQDTYGNWFNNCRNLCVRANWS